ncbi:hypothetical protein ACFSSA_15340 [Luteolibacter algae]|uniref:Uncharacterized protein n=1 Tax=Luteolibacter algae TaxID=454151 RepID=A0ABW5DBX3_9BACT
MKHSTKRQEVTRETIACAGGRGECPEAAYRRVNVGNMIECGGFCNLKKALAPGLD